MRMAIVIDAIIYSGVITPWERGRKSFILSCRVVEPLWDSKERWGAAKTKVGCGFEGEILRCSHTQGRSRRPPLSSVPPFSCWFIAVARKVFFFFSSPLVQKFSPPGDRHSSPNMWRRAPSPAFPRRVFQRCGPAQLCPSAVPSNHQAAPRLAH